jgi:YHS domain-containing protein
VADGLARARHDGATGRPKGSFIVTSAFRDPVCDMPVDPSASLSAVREGRTFFFCSEYCRRFFAAHPDAYLDRASPAGSDDLSLRRLAYFSMEVGLSRTSACPRSA